MKAISPSSLESIKENLKVPQFDPNWIFLKLLLLMQSHFWFQSNWPYAPYLYMVLNNLLRNVIKHFVEANEVKVGVDVDNDENVLCFKMVDLGFLIKSEIKKVKSIKM